MRGWMYFIQPRISFITFINKKRFSGVPKGTPQKEGGLSCNRVPTKPACEGRWISCHRTERARMPSLLPTPTKKGGLSAIDFPPNRPVRGGGFLATAQRGQECPLS